MLLQDAGVIQTEKIPIAKNKNKIAEEFECEFCRANLSISMVKVKQDNTEGSGGNNDDEETIYCMHHTLKNLQNSRLQAKLCKLVFSYGIDEIETLIGKIKDRVVQQQGKGKKKTDAVTSQQGPARKAGQSNASALYQPSSSSKYSGLPTMLK